MWGLALATTLTIVAFVISWRSWGSRPSRARILAVTLAALVVAVIVWMLTERVIGLSGDRGIVILGLIAIVLAAVSVRAGMARVATDAK